jgi:anti-sigma factor RsiW
MNDEELSVLIQRHAQRHLASKQLRAAVQTHITLHAAGRKPPASARLRWPEKISQWLGLAGERTARPAGFRQAASLSLGFVGGVVLTLALVWMMPRMLALGPNAQAMVGDLLSLHVRALGTGPLFQVASSDRHTVKPWFQGKLDYAPEVPDLKEAGFELLGGRVDRLQGHDTAVMAYQLRKHIISAYVMPNDHVQPMAQLQKRGFNAVHWSDGVMQVWAVTDADANELERFGLAWQSRVAASATGQTP